MELNLHRLQIMREYSDLWLNPIQSSFNQILKNNSKQKAQNKYALYVDVINILLDIRNI